MDVGPVAQIMALGRSAAPLEFLTIPPQALENDLAGRDSDEMVAVLKILAEVRKDAKRTDQRAHLAQLVTATEDQLTLSRLSVDTAQAGQAEVVGSREEFTSGVGEPPDSVTTVETAGPSQPEASKTDDDGEPEDQAGAVDPKGADTQDAPPPPDALIEARGAGVPLDDLLNLTLASGGARFSDLTVDILCQAANSVHVRFAPDGQPFVTARTVWDRLLAYQGEGADEPRSAASFVVDWMPQRELVEPRSILWVPNYVPGLGNGVAADMVAILSEAAQIVTTTHLRQKRIDARHMIAAFLTTPEGRQAIADELVQDHPPLRTVFVALRDGLLDHILGQATQAENARSWRQVLSVVDAPDIAEGLRPRSVTVQLPFTAVDHVGRSDEAGGYLENDSLNLAAEARNLADLVCLRASPPPLALGIFGNWGSGKSYFMKMLQEAIRENQRRAPSLFLEGTTPEPVYWENIVHIEFNAWQYLDTNLWASLVNHIFRELNRKAELPGGKTAKDGLDVPAIQSLVSEMDLVQTVMVSAQKDLAVLSQTIADARDQIATLETTETALKERLEQTRVKAGTGLVSSAARASFAALGMPEMARNLGTLGEVGSQSKLAGNRLGLILSSSTEEQGRKFLRGGALVFLGLTGLVALLTFGAAQLSPEFAAVIGRAGVMMSTLAGLAAWLLPHLKYINTEIGTALAEEETIREERAQTLAERDQLEEDMELLHQKVVAETDRLRAAEQEEIRLREIASGAKPQELLARFIEDRAGVSGYRKHLGLLSEIRNDFDHLSQLMAAQRDAEQFNPALPKIERIVLYIDDLDRCRDERVVEVLEAIHLLLAFDLFVVVVAVDARWLDTSVRRFYADHLRQNSTDTFLPTAADFLEKIFQIPYRLPKLTGTNQNSFAGYVDALVGPVTIAAKFGAASSTPDGGTVADDQDPEKEDVTDQALPRLDSPVFEDTETVMETLQRVQLSQAEREAIRAFGCLPGMSPRTTKRFVNLYRLMRSRKRAGALEAWLAEPDGKTARFKVAMLWLAFECGLPRPVMGELTLALRDSELQSLPDFFSLNSVNVQENGAEQRVYRVTKPSLLVKLDILTDGAENNLLQLIGSMGNVTTVHLLEQAAEAGRYSFRIEQ